jgi:hypothetical protein
MTPRPPFAPPNQQRIAAEVVELGQTLFDAVLDAAARSPAGEPLPEEELRTAAGVFFRAVRELLGLAACEEESRP